MQTREKSATGIAAAPNEYQFSALENFFRVVVNFTLIPPALTASTYISRLIVSRNQVPELAGNSKIWAALVSNWRIFFGPGLMTAFKSSYAKTIVVSNGKHINTSVEKVLGKVNGNPGENYPGEELAPAKTLKLSAKHEKIISAIIAGSLIAIPDVLLNPYTNISTMLSFPVHADVIKQLTWPQIYRLNLQAIGPRYIMSATSSVMALSLSATREYTEQWFPVDQHGKHPSYISALLINSAAFAVCRQWISTGYKNMLADSTVIRDANGAFTGFNVPTLRQTIQKKFLGSPKDFLKLYKGGIASAAGAIPVFFVLDKLPGFTDRTIIACSQWLGEMRAEMTAKRKLLAERNLAYLQRSGLFAQQNPAPSQPATVEPDKTLSNGKRS